MYEIAKYLFHYVIQRLSLTIRNIYDFNVSNNVNVWLAIKSRCLSSICNECCRGICTNSDFVECPLLILLRSIKTGLSNTNATQSCLYNIMQTKRYVKYLFSDFAVSLYYIFPHLNKYNKQRIRSCVWHIQCHRTFLLINSQLIYYNSIRSNLADIIHCLR